METNCRFRGAIYFFPRFLFSCHLSPPPIPSTTITLFFAKIKSSPVLLGSQQPCASTTTSLSLEKETVPQVPKSTRQDRVPETLLAIS